MFSGIEEDPQSYADRRDERERETIRELNRARSEIDRLKKEIAALSTTPARAEALDEGAAREPVAWIDPTDISHIDGGWPLVTTLYPNEEVACGATMPLYAHLSPTPAAQDDDRVREAGRMFEALRDQSWDLRRFNVPTGGDDYDIGWRVVGHWMAEPRERTIAEVFVDDPAEAVRQALASLKTEGK